MKISIVVPNLNYIKYIGDCLESIASQAYENIEVIMIDGGSSDGCQEVMRRYADAKPGRWRYFERRHESQVESIIWGLEQSTGEIQCWLNSDDTYLATDALQRVAHMFEVYQGMDCISFGGYYLDEHGRFTDRISLHSHPLLRQRDVRFRGGFVQPATFWKKAVFSTLGLDKSLRYIFDTKFLVLACRHFSVVIDPTVIVAGYRLHGKNLSVGVKADRIRELAMLSRELNGSGMGYFYLRSLGALIVFIDRLPHRISAPLKRTIRLLNNALSFLCIYRWPGI